MAKRFTDTEKWKKRFIKSLEAPYKLLWLYILDDCDHAGIWHVDFDVASIRIGENVNEKKALDIFNSHVKVFDEGEKWFIKDFVDFQYGELKENNRLHLSVLNQLKKYKLVEGACKPLISPLEGAKDKEQYKDKEKDKEKDKKKEKDITEKEKEFRELVFQFNYPKEMLEDFVRYWSEPNKSRTKLKCEMQQTFDIEKRLITWNKNEGKFSKTTNRNNDNLKREILERMATGYGED